MNVQGHPPSPIAKHIRPESLRAIHLHLLLGKLYAPTASPQQALLSFTELIGLALDEKAFVHAHSKGGWIAIFDPRNALAVPAKITSVTFIGVTVILPEHMILATLLPL